MATLGQRLRQARERAGLSVEDLSARTKIQVPLLAAIERDDFDRVPGGLFVRGFLRAYAREVELDPESVVTDYLDQFEPVAREPEDTDCQHADAERDVILAQPDFQGFSWRPVWPALGAAAAIFVVFVTFGRGARPEPVVEAQAVGTTGTIEPASAATAAPLEPPARDGITLDMRAKRDVWVAATGDGTRVMYRILKAGETATVSALEEITARIGDAEALEYSVNGVAGDPIGEPGEVRDILITPGGFRTLKVIVPKPPQPPTQPGSPGT
jgi:transcriptional regulator with XRE-family HTH domain